MTPPVSKGGQAVRRPGRSASKSLLPLVEILERNARHLQAIRTTTLALVLIAAVATAYFARDFLLPVVLAFLLALTLRPIVRYLERRGVAAGISAVILVAGIVAVVAAGIFFLSGPVSHWLDTAPQVGQELSRKLSVLRSPVKAVVAASEQVQNITEGASSPNVQKVVIQQPGLLSRAADTLVSAVTTTGVTLVLLLFLLASGSLFYEKMIAVLPTLSDKKKALRVAYDVETEVSRYLFTITIINIGVGVVVAVGMAMTGMPNPALWGVAAAILNFIPYIGALIGVAMITVVAILSFDTIGQAMIPPMIFVACHIAEGQFLTPIILGRRLELNSVAIFIALALWSWLWGIVGAIIAVPLLVSIKVFCDHFDGLTSFGEFLSAGPSKTPSEDTEADDPLPSTSRPV
jgi:predicted PurR-regulated permease PerM